MMISRTPLSLLVVAAFSFPALAADVTGTWKAEFDTQRGLQKYTFTLKQDGANLTGKASAEHGGQKREAELKEGKVDGDTVIVCRAAEHPGQRNPHHLHRQGLGRRNQVHPQGRRLRHFGGRGQTQDATAPTQPAAAQPAAQPPPGAPGRRGGRGGFGGPITLGPDDKPAFPTGRKVSTSRARASRTASSKGSITIPRPSARNAGCRFIRRPAIPRTQKYPVLYLLHGIGGNENEEWTRQGSRPCDPRQSDRRQKDRADDRRLPQRQRDDQHRGRRPRRRAGTARRPALRRLGKALRERSAQGHHSLHRVELLREDGSREPRAGRTFDGRRAVAEHRPGQPRYLRLGRRLLLRAEHEAGRGTGARRRTRRPSN